MPYAALAQELFEIMDPQKRRPPNEEMDKVMRGEMAVMRLIEKEARDLSAGEISKMLHMTTSRIAAVLSSLEKKELVTRCADPKDGRRVMVMITAAGRAFCAQKHEEVRCHMERMLRQMGETDAKEYVRLTRRMLELMHKDREGGAI